MNKLQREAFNKAMLDFQKAQRADVVEAETSGSVPFYSDWTIRPKNFWLRQALRGSRSMVEGDPIYNQTVSEAQKEIEQAREKWKQKNPQKSSWFGW